MMKPLSTKLLTLALTAASVAGCQTAIVDQPDTIARPERVYPTTANWPDTLYVFGTGYPKSGDPCYAIGESDAVINYLDHTERLFGCPTMVVAQALGGQIVGQEGEIILVSVEDVGS